jgi:alkanesulfonate monooxygenase SsuD/methylene tetrahydromethanopterin reductase-like flavin-dependent oxidoreductase (luciferase family)
MKIGYFPCTQDPPKGENVARVWDEIVAEAQAAEAAGFDGCFVPEHHQQEDGFLPNALIVAGLIGMKTERIDVGTCATVVPLHHPIHLAEDCALIDQATKGRLILSVGVGYQPQDFEVFGVNAKQRVGRTEEGIAILRQAWRAERFSFIGKYFKLSDVLITPGPYRKPGPPIWFASWSPPGIDRAARIGDGWISDPLQSLPVIKEYTNQYRDAAAKHGTKPYICLMRDAVVAGTRSEAEARSGPVVAAHQHYFGFGVHTEDEYLKDVKGPEDLTFERIAEDRLLYGSPQDCLDQLQHWRDEIRPDYMILRLRFGGDPSHEKTLQTIRLFGEEILPKL